MLERETTLPNGIYKLGCAVNTNYVLNVYGNGSTEGTNVCLWERTNNNGDQWVVQTGEDGYCRLREVNSNKYFEND